MHLLTASYFLFNVFNMEKIWSGYSSFAITPSNSKTTQTTRSCHNPVVFVYLKHLNTGAAVSDVLSFWLHGRLVSQTLCLTARHGEGGGAIGEVALTHTPWGCIFTPRCRVRHRRLHSLSHVPGFLIRCLRLSPLLPKSSHSSWLHVADAAGRFRHTVTVRKTRELELHKLPPWEKWQLFTRPARSHLRSRVLGCTLLIISPRRAPDQRGSARAKQRRQCVPGARAAPRLRFRLLYLPVCCLMPGVLLTHFINVFCSAKDLQELRHGNVFGELATEFPKS